MLFHIDKKRVILLLYFNHMSIIMQKRLVFFLMIMNRIYLRLNFSIFLLSGVIEYHNTVLLLNFFNGKNISILNKYVKWP